MELLEGLVRRAGNTGDDEMVVVGDDRMSADALLALADATASRIRGARAIAVCATPSMSTVVGVVSALRAGVAIVPVASDSGPAERDHIWVTQVRLRSSVITYGMRRRFPSSLLAVMAARYHLAKAAVSMMLL